ncbi:hypothetical protein DFQ28_009862 [Apophysomyces sp. BC1034]|nr:hypothetical protein DFQ30_011350 [Apophysomyces sp. BC1015]KAG0185153.1 hypothetical protein DFQ28_009862 [Apophysomyces sp. BC1034]
MRPSVRKSCQIGLVGLATCVMWLATSAAGACTLPGPVLEPTTVPFPERITVPFEAGIGAEVISVTVPVNGLTTGQKYTKCPSVNHVWWAREPGLKEAGEIAPTHIPGIGYTASLSGGLSAPMGTPIPTASDTELLTVSEPIYITVKLFKTAATVEPGVLSLNSTGTGGPPNQAAALYVGNDGTALFRVVTNHPVIEAPACRVKTPKIAVLLGTVDARILARHGISASAEFSIDLECMPGRNLAITLTDSTNRTNQTDQLSLTPDSSATGVKLQILRDNGVPVHLGPAEGAPGSPGQWTVGVTPAGQMSIRLAARYIQTEPRIGAGTANGIATFTLNYP